MSPDGSSFWLYLADGGSVYFESVYGPYWDYRAKKVIDPNGLATILEYEQGRLRSVLEPAGRSLQFTWEAVSDPIPGNPPSPPLIKKVESGTGTGSQAVEYTYSWYTGYHPHNQTQYRWVALTGAQYLYQGAVVPDEYSAYTYEPLVVLDPEYNNPWLIRAKGPALSSADDTRFARPMKRIRYVYYGGAGGSSYCAYFGPPPGNGQGPFFTMMGFAVEKELNWDGVMVSQLIIPCNGPGAGRRTEIHGAGGSRIFYYGIAGGLEPGTQYYPGNNGTSYWTPPEATPDNGNYPGYNGGHELTKLTDFADNPAVAPFDFTHNYSFKPWRVFDRKGILTQYVYPFYPGGAVQPEHNGRVQEVWHRGADNSTNNGTAKLSYRSYNWNPSAASAPRDATRIPNFLNHWLFSKTDENGHTTAYTRDSLRRVTHVQYSGGSAEAFEQYNQFNQYRTHRLPSAAVKTYEYDGRGLLKREWNSADGGEANATIYTHDAFDRVETISHAWSRAKGAAFSVKMTYNACHQVLTEEYPATNGGPNPTKEYSYDPFGNCIGIKNELGAWSTYAYDDYRRCISYTEPLNAPDWKGNGNVPSRSWEWTYDRVDYPGGAYHYASTHTSKNWRLQFESAFNGDGGRQMSERRYDYNGRMLYESTGWIAYPWSWSYSPDGETHFFNYDPNGNKTWYRDPQGRETTYTYDKRDRLTKTTEPQSRVTENWYDAMGNKTLVKFPDNQTQQWLYHDPFGQPRQSIDERGNVTHLDYWPWGPMKKLARVTTHREKDGGGLEDQPTNFYYDLMGRPQTTVFPDGSYEYTGYEFGQVNVFETRQHQVKRISYDARGRETLHTWDNDAAPRIDRTWDAASRMTRIGNIHSIIEYEYDDAAQPKYEDNDITGAGGRVRTTFRRYPNGDLANLGYPAGPWARRDYSARGQLNTAGVADGAGNWQFQLINYYYHPDGKVKNQDYGNGVGTGTGENYDGRGFPRSIHTYRFTPTYLNYAYRAYSRDTRDRIVSWDNSADSSANPMQDGRGHRFQYDFEGQLTDVWYGPYDPANSTAGSEVEEHFDYDKMGNRMESNRLAGRGDWWFWRRDNGLNQYLGWPLSGINYDGNGALAHEGNFTANFNALNQPNWVWGPNVPGGYKWFGYDPLGRCVKRWDSGSTTYYYYDGWNLIQEGPGAGSPTRLYVHGNRVDEIPVTFNVATSQYGFHHYDLSGNCMMTTGSDGGIMEQYYYWAFGTPRFFTAGTSWSYDVGYSPFGNRFLFSGREWLNELKVYDFRHRMYQPELGRFLQPDPKQFAAGDYNLYRYCHNDPVNRSDPFGLADSVRIIFEPSAGNMKPVWTTAERIEFYGDSRGEAVTLIPPQGGITTTAKVDPVTNDVAVIQKVQAVTLLPKSQEAEGTKSALATEEMSRIEGYRTATTNAGVAANELAEKGFKGNAEAAKRAVEASTKAILKEKTQEMRRQYDLNHGRTKK